MSPAEIQSRLIDELRRYDGLTIAVSGGIDSMTLACVAHRFAGYPVTMVHAVSPAVPPAATARVRAYAAREGWTLELVDAGEFSDPSYLANPVNRCYFCKSHLYDSIRSRSGGPVASGANLDDLGDFRPGLKAAAERRVVHPLVDSGIDKAAVRALARWLALTDIADLPAQPCLASRVETGIGINAGDLAFIDEVEGALRGRLSELAIVRCRITRAGVVIEVGDGIAAGHDAIAATVEPLCARAGRSFAGVCRYRQGSAFLKSASASPGVTATETECTASSSTTSA